MSRLPDFVVLGQGKAGTSLIYRVFERHPQVGLSRPKELFFYNQRFDRGLDWYLPHFDHLEPEATRVGEICPAYLDPEAVERIHATLGPDAQMIFVLRHPIEQAYSRYLQNVCAARGQTALKFRAEHVLTNRFEQLHAALETLYRLYDRAQILPLSFEQDIDATDAPFEARICDFLGVEQSDNMALFRKRGKVNAGVMPRFVYGGEGGQSLQCEGQAYDIPPRALVFCAQPRNSEASVDVSAEDAAAAQERAGAWMDSLTEAHFARLQSELVMPFAARLEQDFGLDLAHWDVPARAITYDLAPPPAAFLAEGSA